jgi:AraC-like DNA-binding protein
MKIYIKYNIEKTCRVILREQLDKLGLEYTILNAGCIQFSEIVPQDIYTELTTTLNRYDIQIVDNNKALLTQKTKEVINGVLRLSKTPLVKMSVLLEQNLGMSYRNIAKAFTEVSHMSIEEYIIMQKIEKVKNMLVNEKLTLTEVAHRLQYSSVGHLSNQFKKTTGLSPKDFQNVMRYKRNYSIQ